MFAFLVSEAVKACLIAFSMWSIYQTATGLVLS